MQGPSLISCKIGKVWREKINGFQRQKVFNALKSHPEDLDPCPSSRHTQHWAELSAVEGGAQLLVPEVDDCLPGAGIFLLLEKTENSASLVQDDAMQEGRREHWGPFLVLFKVSGQQACLGQCHGSREHPSCWPCIRQGLKHPEQCLDRSYVTWCPNLAKFLLGTLVFEHVQEKMRWVDLLENLGTAVQSHHGESELGIEARFPRFSYAYAWTVNL